MHILYIFRCLQLLPSAAMLCRFYKIFYGKRKVLWKQIYSRQFNSSYFVLHFVAGQKKTHLCIIGLRNVCFSSLELQGPTILHSVSSRERPWRHWSRPRIHAARPILYASISAFLFEMCEKTHKLRARWQASVFLRNNALTSRSFSRWDKVYLFCSTAVT